MATKEDKSKKKKKQFGKKLISGLVIGLFSALVTWLLSLTPFIKKLEMVTLDLRFRERSPIVQLPDIGYVNLDTESCELAGDWPWTRNFHKALVESLAFYDARAAGYDVFFVEPSDIYIRAPQSVDSLENKDNSRILKDTFGNYDKELEIALKNSQRIYLGEFLTQAHQVNRENTEEEILKYIKEDKENDVNKSKFQIESRETIQKDPYTFTTTDPLIASIAKAVTVDAPLKDLTLAAKGVGFEQIIPDALTKNVYEYPMFMSYDGRVHSALALVIISDILGIDLTKASLVDNSIKLTATKDYGDYKAGDIYIPVNDKTHMLMNWSGTHFGTFFHISYKSLSYYYAYNKSKERIRELDINPKNLSVIINDLSEMITRDRMVHEDQVFEIVSNVIIAKILSKDITQSNESLIKKIKAFKPFKEIEASQIQSIISSIRLSNDAIAQINNSDLEQVSNLLKSHKPLKLQSFKAISDQYPGLNSEHQDEILRNILLFKSNNNLQDIAPYYFPPKQKTLSNGKEVSLSPTMLKDKILMVGLEGEGTIDLNPQPYEKACAMVALHANAMNTFLTRQFLQFPNKSVTAFWIFTFGLLIGLITHFMRGTLSILLTLVIIGGFSWYSLKVFDTQGIHLELIPPSLTLALTYFISMGVQLFLAYREKQKVKGMFGKMVSPDVLKVMSDNPDLFSLTGRRQSCTSYFSSMEGFAEMSKGVTAQELPGLLGHYLTPSSQIITSYDGYIDKYESHIIMADFGVPLPDDRHPTKCLFASVEQQLDVNAFKKYVKARFAKDIVVSMGVNTGFVSAGNMGSDKKMQYTIMGDTVNTAARFRPANWIYNQLGSIIIGEMTYPIVKDYIEVRVLDKLLLKGKLKPVTIYQVMGWNSKVYLDIRKDIDPFPTLKTCWTKLPAEKILGYHQTWKAYHDKSSAGLADDISRFFGQYLDLSSELAELEVKAEIQETWRNFIIEEEHFKTILGRELEKPQGKEWNTKLDQWSKQLERDLHELKPKAEVDMDANKLHLNLQDIHDKVEALNSRLGEDVDLPDNFKNKWNQIRDYVSSDFGSDQQDFRNTYAEKFSGYESQAIEFATTVAAKKEEYHEMMSIVGSRSDSEIKGCQAFEAALDLYWQRDWNGALAKFEETLAHMPGDKGATSFIDRVKLYKENPPPDNWQGEFKQTKK